MRLLSTPWSDIVRTILKVSIKFCGRCVALIALFLLRYRQAVIIMLIVGSKVKSVRGKCIGRGGAG